MGTITITDEELQARINAETEGLKNKNSELLGKLSKIKDLDIDQLLADSKAFAEFQKKSAEEKGEYKTLYEQLKSATDTEATTLKTKVSELESQITSMKKTSAISKALSEKQVDPLLLDLAVNSVVGDAAIDDKGNVLVKGKPLKDFTESWANSEIGKRFIISGNSGGNGTGGDGGGGDTFAKYFDPKSEHYSVTKQAELAKTNVAEYNRLSTQFKK
jgi:hypothetical protein